MFSVFKHDLSICGYVKNPSLYFIELEANQCYELCKLKTNCRRKMQRSSSVHVHPQPTRNKYITHCIPLHKAALKGDWNTAEYLLIEDPVLAKISITEGGETALHVAAVEGHLAFVENLLENMERSDTEIPNIKGVTALCFAAAAGHVDVAKLMVNKNQTLPTIRSPDGVRPIYMAALLGHSDMAEYLFPLSDLENWTPEDQISLLTTSIDSGLYGLALGILNQNKTLAVAQDSNGETPLEVLARKPLSLCGNSQQGGPWGTILAYMRFTRTPERQPSDAFTLFDCLWDAVIRQEDVEAGQLFGNTSKLLFVAAESGNDEFLVEIISRYPDFLYKSNSDKHTIFHIAVSRRYVQVFSLIFELSCVKNLISSYIDNDGNNMLHLVAKLAPHNQLSFIPGAALQMQREVLWFKEVEKIVRPSDRNMKNNAGQTPIDLFLAEHRNLMHEGEKMMKQTAKSCMLVTMLIATVVFTTAFTVPGGYDNNNGAPILRNNKLFMVFPVSEAVATLSSLTSMLMFLSILTSRYAPDDFLSSLPFWLVVGVFALFVSIVAMMVAFCTCLLFYEHGWVTITMVLTFFAGVPIMFVVVKYRLLVNVVRCTYGSHWLFRSNNRLFG